MASIGIEWVKKYHGRGANVSNTQKAAEGFYNTLHGTRMFNWGDDLAWDQDFEEQGQGNPATGTDTTWVDSVDIAFFAGHGSSQGPVFGIESHDNGQASSTEVRWGNGNLEWIIFHACEVLKSNGVIDRWGPAFRGLHYILGFHTICHDESKRGRYFAEYLNAGQRVRAAWIKACQETEESETQWAYLRADADGTDTFNDHWHHKGFVSSDPNNPTDFVYQRGSC